MARDLPIVIADKEDIISYEYYLVNKMVRVLVGVGNTDVDNNFIPQPEQNYQVYEIKGDKFDALMASDGTKPQGVFRKEDLWAPIDATRVEEKAKLEVIPIEETPVDTKVK